MNDINALAQRMKAAAEKATPGRIGDRIDGSGSIKYQCFGSDGSLVLQTDHKNMEYGFIGPNSNADELFFRMCSPENIKALVEALEKEQQRIAELESRSVTVKLPEGLVKAVNFYEQVKRENPPTETGAWKDAIDWVLKEATRAAGIQVIEGEGK